MRKLPLIYSFILFGSLTALKAQDIHFSQYFESPILLNPACSGAGPNDFRLTVNYRNQWQNIISPFNTAGLAFDSRINKRNKRKDNRADNYFGYGLSMYNDKAGLSKLTTNQLEGNGAYHLFLNTRHSLSFGIKLAFFQRVLNTSNLKWDAQFNGKTYDSGLSSQETAVFQSIARFDLGTGLLYRYHNRTTGDRIDAGISMSHIMQPEVSFYGDASPLMYKYIVHSNYIKKLSGNIYLKPTMIFIKQGTHTELNAGLNVRLDLNTDIAEGLRNQKDIFTSSFQLGLHHRYKDALIALAGFEFNRTIYIGLSYDVNVSKLIKASNLRGGYELSLVFTQQKNSKLRTKY